MNNEQLTSFTIFDVDRLCLYGIHRTKRRHDMLFKQQSRHNYHRNGAPSVCFGIDVGGVRRTKSLPNATNGLMVSSAITFSRFGNNKIGFGSNLIFIDHVSSVC